MLVYDITKQQSFEHASRWLEEIRSHADNNIVIMLIGNKCDLGTLRAVLTENAKQFAQDENLFFMETSAMESTNVEIAFLMVLSEIYRIVSKKSLMANEELEASNSTRLLKGTDVTVPVDQEAETPVKSTCCLY